MAELHIIDYVVFGAMLLVSLGIGVYHSFAGDKQRTTDEYLMGNRQMKVIPVTLSFTVSFISSILILGFPAEIYSFGAGTVTGTIGSILGVILAVVIFVPVLYPLQYTSVNEYLEERYQSKVVRGFGSFFAIGGAILYCSNVYFGPSTAIEAVTGFPAWLSILLCSTISIIYTTIGGYKAVIWTDVFQSLVMFIGMLGVVIQGVITVGGFERMWELNSEWGRLEFFNFDPDPRTRLTFWGCTIGRIVLFLSVCGCWQPSFQRYSSMPSQSGASKVVFLAWPGMTILSSMAYLSGFAVFAYYAGKGCDPVAGGILDNANQLVPYFVMEIFKVPGLAGLFLAAATAGSLSSASSGLNASAGNMWQDILRHILPPVSQLTAARITKFTVLIFGMIASGMAYAYIGIGGTVVQIMGTFGPCFDGPNLAIYLLGIFVPWVTWKGASVGCIFGITFSLWASFGSYSLKKQLDVMPTPIETCDIVENITSWINTTTSQAPYSISTVAYNTSVILEETSIPWTHHIYSLSFYWLAPIIVTIVMVTAVITSFILGANSYHDVEPRLIHPWMRRLLRHTDDGPTYRKNTDQSFQQDIIRVIENPLDEPEKQTLCEHVKSTTSFIS